MVAATLAEPVAISISANMHGVTAQLGHRTVPGTQAWVALRDGQELYVRDRADQI